jgi:integrase
MAGAGLTKDGRFLEGGSGLHGRKLLPRDAIRSQHKGCSRRREPRPRRKPQAWTVEDARWFLESAWHSHEALYAAFVLVLVLGLRRGEVLGLTWDAVDLVGDEPELYVGEQLQRVRHELVLREVKTETSEAPIPLPGLCVTALNMRKRQQDSDRDKAGDGWVDSGLIFTSRHGTPIEPRNFNRSFERCIVAARVPRITVHGTRKTCASLLAALDVHPRVAMRILRHSKIAITMEVYTQAPSDATRDALNKLSDWLA